MRNFVRAIFFLLAPVSTAAFAQEETSSNGSAASQSTPDVAVETAAAPPAPMADHSPSWERRPRPQLRSGQYWITDVDYPAISWRNGEVGKVDYRLLIDKKGKPTRCDVTSSSGHRRLDELTCALLMQRASFTPARDENYENTSGIYEHHYVWSRAQQPLDENYEVVMTAIMGPAMDRSSCTVEWTGKLPDKQLEHLRINGCPLPNLHEDVPFRDENGEPVSKRVTFTMRYEIEDVEVEKE